MKFLPLFSLFLLFFASNARISTAQQCDIPLPPIDFDWLGWREQFPYGFDRAHDHYVYEKEISSFGVTVQEIASCYLNDNADINMQYIWDRDISGSADFIVAIIDTGIWADKKFNDYNNNRVDGIFENRIWVNKGEIPNNGIDDDGNGYVDDVEGWNFFYNTGHVDSLYKVNEKARWNEFDTHGTTVAAVGFSNGTVKGLGIDTKCKLMNLNVFSKLPYYGEEEIQKWSNDGVAEAIRYAVDNGAKVINISLYNDGIWVPSKTTSINQGKTDEELLRISADYFDNSFARAVSYAWQKGAIIVQASGNYQKEDEFSTHFLQLNQYSRYGAQPEILTVGAIERGSCIFAKNFITGGGKQDVVAFNNVPDNWNSGFVAGSSIAAPQVAAMISLFWSQPENRHLKNWEVKKIFLEAAMDGLFTHELEEQENSEIWLAKNGLEYFPNGTERNGNNWYDAEYAYPQYYVQKDEPGWDMYYGYGLVRFDALFERRKYRTVDVNPENGAVDGYTLATHIDIEDIKKYTPLAYEEEFGSITSIVESQKQEEFIIYPNPTTDYIKSTVGGSYFVMNLLGQKTGIEGNMREGEPIDLPNLQNGKYALVVNNRAKIFEKK